MRNENTLPQNSRESTDRSVMVIQIQEKRYMLGGED
jgi:hypothetical protein